MTVGVRQQWQQCRAATEGKASGGTRLARAWHRRTYLSFSFLRGSRPFPEAPSRHALRPSPVSFIRKVENYSNGLAHPGGGSNPHTKIGMIKTNTSVRGGMEGRTDTKGTQSRQRVGLPSWFIQGCPWRASCEQCPSGSRGLADRVPSTRRRSSSASFAKRSHAQSRAASSQLAATTLASSRCGCTFFHWTATVATEPCGAAPPFPLPSLAPADAVA